MQMHPDTVCILVPCALAQRIVQSFTHSTLDIHTGSYVTLSEYTFTKVYCSIGETPRNGATRVSVSVHSCFGNRGRGRGNVALRWTYNTDQNDHASTSAIRTRSYPCAGTQCEEMVLRQFKIWSNQTIQPVVRMRICDIPESQGPNSYFAPCVICRQCHATQAMPLNTGSVRIFVQSACI